MYFGLLAKTTVNVCTTDFRAGYENMRGGGDSSVGRAHNSW